MTAILTRRSVLASGGALVMAFSLSGARAENKDSGSTKLPGSLEDTPKLDAWIRIDRSGTVTILTGKAELGQGVKTALLQIAAEELKVPFAGLTLITADTSLTADEGYTAASHSLQDSGTAIRNATAQVREILIGEAARRLNVDRAELRAANGTVFGPNDVHIGYGELVRNELLAVDAQPTSRLTPAPTSP
jgi:nicotinate dehydrogenase subunit B